MSTYHPHVTEHCGYCGNPLGVYKIFHKENGFIHQWCFSRIRRNQRKKGKGKFPCPSKPLRPKGYGYDFRPDKQIVPIVVYPYWRDRKGERIRINDRIYERKYRKQQRRVDKFFIEEALMFEQEQL